MSDGLWSRLKAYFQTDEAPAEEKPKIVIPEVIIERKGAAETAVSPQPASDIDAIFLRQQMSNHLDEAQLVSIGETIGLDYAALTGGKGRKVLELVTAFEKEGKLSDLLHLCQAQDAKIEWQMEKNDE